MTLQLFGVTSANPVIHTINEPGKFIRNTTLDGHVFHNQNDPAGSYVDQVVDSSSGPIKIGLIGHGTGEFPDTNVLAGPVIFGEQHKKSVKKYRLGKCAHSNPSHSVTQPGNTSSQL